MTPLTLVIMAAGAGSRFGGPKQLDPVGPGGDRLLDYAVYDAIRAGIGRVVLIVRPDLRDRFADAVRRRPPALAVEIVTQRIDDVPAGVPAGRTKPWGTTHAVLAARDVLHGPFVVVNADDFYGVDAYRIAAGRASSQEATVVAMRLDRTLSPHGGVTRAVCEIAGNRVARLEEVRDIARRHDGRIHAAGGRVLTGAELVSMNCWVLPATMVARLAERFAAFAGAHGGSPDAECMLPETMNDLVARADVTLCVVETPGPWFGLTHAADRDAVAEGLQRLVARGVYPRSLWRPNDDPPKPASSGGRT